MNKSESIVKLSHALVKFHGAMGKVGKDSINPHFRNKYASLSNSIEATTPDLNALGLAVLYGALGKNDEAFRLFVKRIGI